jgi:hypothetical protein
VWKRNRANPGGYREFFLINLSHDNLENYYRTNFELLQNFNYSLTELDNMIPWEREIYLTLLKENLEEKKDRQRQQ